MGTFGFPYLQNMIEYHIQQRDIQFSIVLNGCTLAEVPGSILITGVTDPQSYIDVMKEEGIDFSICNGAIQLHSSIILSTYDSSAS